MSDNTQDVLKDAAASAAAAAAAGGSLFSTFDIIVLVILLGGTIWWLYNSKKENKKDEILLSKYSIQAAGSIQVTENSFITKLKSSGRSLVVFYGSQTGTAEEFAGRLAKEGIRYKLKGMVADPEECDMEELTKLQEIDNSLAVFCMATYGEGDPTDNSMEFYEWLKNGDPNLTGLNYALPNDMENYMRYRVMGTVDRVMLKHGCLPTKFQCQSDRKRSLPSTVTSRPAAIKRQRLALVQEALEDTTLQSDTNEVNTTLSPSLPVEVIVKHQPKSQDKGVQVFVKSTYFRSKSTQTELKFHTIATSPSKTWTSTVSTSPFKVEHVKPAMPSASKTYGKLFVDGSDSDTSLRSQSIFQPSSPSVQSVQVKSLSGSSSLNEEEAILDKNREAKQALDNICKKIKAKPRLYLGITNNCYFLLNLIEKNTNIPLVNILLSLKKIRLNTTFSELSDQFGISTSYAGKIFRKCIPMISDILKSFIVKLDKKKIKTSLPIAFRHRYNKVNCIIDCFEIEIEKPSKAVHQALTWSEYKKANTIKYLISSTPNGLVNYVSSGYGGRISDTLLVENCGFLDQLEPGSWVLADRGFKHIEQILKQKNCHLLRPPSVTQGAKLGKKEAHQTKQIASLRIHIERVIRRVREFSMLKAHSVVNSKLISVLDECVLIACALINLQDPIVY